MHKAFFIGSGHSAYSKALAKSGCGARAFKNADDAIDKLDGADLIVIAQGGPRPSKLLKASRGIPKIVIAGAPPAAGAWFREPLCHVLHAPEPADFVSLAQRVLKEHARMAEAEALRKSIADMKGELEFIEQINKILLSAEDMNDILVTIMRRAMQLTGASDWGVMLEDKEDGTLTCVKATPRIKRACHIRLASGQGVAGHVFSHGKPILITNAASDKRLNFGPSRRGCRCGAKTIVAAPLTSNGKFLGVLELIDKADGSSFTKDDMALLAGFSSQASVAVEHITLQQRLEELVITDDLTNLFNSRYLNRSIETEILRSRRYNTSISVIFMDIDHFKDVNDRHGHLAGSRVLVEMGQILIKELRNIDIVARYGGDEFVLVLPQTSLHNAMIIAERIRKTIEDNTFLQADGLNLRLTASFGVAAYPETAHSKEDLLRLSDESMYKVKNRTRNGVYAII